MRIMCHVGPWCIKQYQTIASAIDEEAETILISGFRAVDQSGLVKRFNDNLNINIKVDNAYSHLDLPDIISRCRLLRSLNKSEAQHHVYSMAKAISDVFDSYQPDLVLSETIDQYVMDLVYFECLHRKIKFVGLLVSCINGYYRISSRGEYNYLRKVNEDEAMNVLQYVESIKYKSDIISNSEKYISYYTIKRWFGNVARIPYFFMKRYLSRERNNYHYWASQVSSMANFHLVPKINLGDKNWEEKIKEVSKPVIYIPLQMYPEATVEYWCQDLNTIDYEVYLLALVEKLSVDFTLLIKEHPNVIGVRNPNLYKKLYNMNNVIIAPIKVCSNFLVDLCSAVLVWTGSVGLEAALRGNPVFVISDVYYLHGNNFKKVSLETPNNELIKFIQEVEKNSLDDIGKVELVSHVLSGLFPGNYINNASWSETNSKNIDDAKLIGSQIRDYIELD